VKVNYQRTKKTYLFQNVHRKFQSRLTDLPPSVAFLIVSSLSALCVLILSARSSQFHPNSFDPLIPYSNFLCLLMVELTRFPCTVIQIFNTEKQTAVNVTFWSYYIINGYKKSLLPGAKNSFNCPVFLHCKVCSSCPLYCGRAQKKIEQRGLLVLLAKVKLIKI